MTGRTRHLLIFSAGFLMFSVRTILGAELEVSSVVNPTRISLNELVTVTVTISGANALRAKKPVLDTMPDFTILGPTSTSQNFSFINGRTSIVKSYTYRLRATKIGTFNVGAVTVKVRNRGGDSSVRAVQIAGELVCKSLRSAGAAVQEKHVGILGACDMNVRVTVTVEIAPTLSLAEFFVVIVRVQAAALSFIPEKASSLTCQKAGRAFHIKGDNIEPAVCVYIDQHGTFRIVRLHQTRGPRVVFEIATGMVD